MHTPLPRISCFSVLLLSCFLLLGYQQSLVAQTGEPTSFSSNVNLLQNNNFSGVNMAITDVDGDGKDDIVRFDNGRFLNIQFQNNPNRPFTNSDIQTVAIQSQWANTIADLDNDGDNDIIVGGSYDNLKLLRNNGSRGDFTISNIGNSDFFVQGTNFIDIDGDGYLDLFSCNDEGDNFKFRNNRTGGLINDASLINTTTSTASDNSGNYSSIWTDHDNDGDLDLYISKCRAGVTDATDPRRVNMLFENDGNNNFLEVGASARLNSGAQTWTTDFADIDNDGDLDAFILNHYDDSKLMRNNGNGTYTDITSSTGLNPFLGANSGIFGLQSIFRDFNNDGFVDLLFTGSSHYIFYNNGDRTFTSDPNPFTSDMVSSAAVGDLNHDGFLDIYASYAEFVTTPSDIPDDVFFNEGNSNNYVAIQLEGTESNTNGIGARLELYGAWGIQVREVRAGEGYGVMNSLTQHFGIGQESTASKLVIHWPSGTTQEIPNPQPNEFLTIKEPSACLGQSCNDGDACTTNDVFDDNCNCIGTFEDDDNDGVCNLLDICPGSDDNQDTDNDGIPNGCDDCNQNLIGQSCNDANPCTANDTYDDNCNCTGTLVDSDNDGICDANDPCPNFNNNLIGQSCDDGDPCTIGETYSTNCDCSGGVYIDADGDGYCISNDANDSDPCVPDNTAGPCQTADSDCDLINFTGFEGGDLGIWRDGGTGARLTSNPDFATTGTSAYYIFGNQGINSSIYTAPISTISGPAKLTFSYYAYELEAGDTFIVECSTDGSTFEIIKTMTSGVEFNNFDRDTEVIDIDKTSSQLVIRIRATFNETTDYLMLDDIKVERCEDDNVITCTAGTPCDDGDPCTTGETLDVSCNCIGGTFQDSDSDGICDSQDICPNFNNNLIGQPCNDGNDCTVGERWTSNCNCSGGITTDNDNDGFCAALDADDNDPCIPDSSGTDCNTTVTTSTDCQILNFTSFEDNNFGIWIDGGESARILSGTTYANSGLYSFYVQGNDGTQSSLYSTPSDYSEYSNLKLTYNLLTLNVESGDNFVVEVSTGNGIFNIYQVVTVGVEIANNTRYDVELDIIGIQFTNQTSLRIRSRCDSASDYFIIDDLQIEGCGDLATSCAVGSSCNDGNPCTTGSTFDSDCNCTGGTYIDSDGDGICDANDLCPNFNNSLIGQPCNDGDACTVGEVWTSNCGCSGGTTIDNDNDGYCAAQDSNDNDPCIPDASASNCGGSTTLTEVDCSSLYFTDFENGDLGVWIDGGNSARIFTSIGYANSGTYSFFIQAGDGIASSVYTSPLDLSAYDEVKLDFFFYAFSMEEDDEFYLEIGLDGDFSVVKTFRVGEDFNTDDRILASLSLEEFEFTANTVIRFRNGSNSSADYVIFDDMRISGCIEQNISGPACNVGTACNDNNSCTIGEAFDSNCDCVGGTYIDGDNDGYCIGEDLDDNDECIPDNSNCQTALNCTTLIDEDFENNSTGQWNAGGEFSALLNSVNFANSGFYVFYIRNNQGQASSLYSNALDLSSYTSAYLNFNYSPYAVENGDKFVIDVALDGVNYVPYKTYTTGIDIFNEQREDESLLITGLNFSDRTRIRFRAETDSETDYFMIDDIILEGCTGQNNLQEEDDNLNTRAITNLDTEALHKDIKLYPNPAHNQVNISNLKLEDNQVAQLSIYDLQGRLVIDQQPLEDASSTINISTIDGNQLYLFRITIVSEDGEIENKSFMLFKS